MIELAILFRALNLYAHFAHNMTKGLTFFQDHAFFGELYETADDFYDQLIERIIGTSNETISLSEIDSKANALISKGNDNYYGTIKAVLEKSLSDIEKLCRYGKFSVGTLNLLQGQADQIEVILYKIKQKMK